MEKTTLTLVWNQRLIKKDVNKQIKYFHLVSVEQAINLWAFPLGSSY